MVSSEEKTCPECFGAVGVAARFCRHCGADQAQVEATRPDAAMTVADPGRPQQNPSPVASAGPGLDTHMILVIVWILATLCCALGFCVVLLGLAGLGGLTSEGDLASRLEGGLSGLLWMTSGLILSVTSCVLARAVTYMFRIVDDEGSP